MDVLHFVLSHSQLNFNKSMVVTPIVGLCNCSMFSCTLLFVLLVLQLS